MSLLELVGLGIGLPVSLFAALVLGGTHCPVGDGESYVRQGIPRLAAEGAMEAKQPVSEWAGNALSLRGRN